eukprot:1958605-Lingulodinium_polyedra.AAC.1
MSHNDAVDATVCRHSGSRIVRFARSMRTPVFGVRMVCARRAICESLRRPMGDSTASLCIVSRTLHNDSVETTVCRHSGSRIARLARFMRTPVFGVCMVCARRAICESLWRRTVDSIASLCSVSRTLRNDAVESTVCRHGGSQIARFARSMRTPVFGVRV